MRRRMPWIRRCLTCFGPIILGATAVAAQTTDDGAWTQFRGPNVAGVSHERDVFPQGAFALGVAWRATVGEGISGVAIANGLAVTLAQRDEVTWVVAIDTETGNEQWRYQLAPAYYSPNGTYHGPFSTPLIAGNAVVGLSRDGRLAGLDLATGDLLWSVELENDLEAARPQHGFVTSPIMFGDTVVVQIGAEDAAVAGFDPASGRVLWATGRDEIAYQSPAPMTLGGRRQLVAVGQQLVMGLDPETGELLWEQPHNGDGFTGVQSLVPVAAGAERVFLANKHHSSTLFDVRQRGGEVAARELWEERTIRNSFAVPVYHDGYLYGYSSRFLVCADAETGEAIWRSRPPGDGWLMLVDDHLVIVTKEGSLHVVKASPDGYQEVASLELFDEPSWTHPSFANGHIYARSETEVARVDIRRAARLTDADRTDDLHVATGGFAQFLRDVAQTAQKSQVVDQFLASVEQFPLVEDETRVHFIYRGPADDVAIAGDITGARFERPMERVEDTDLFYYTAELDPAARLNYHFIRDYEEMPDPRNPRTTTTMVYGADMEVLFVREPMTVSWMAMPGWEAPAHLSAPAADWPRGRLVRHDIDSEALGERIVLQAYVPSGYDTGGGERYPVAYYHDGAGALARGGLPTSLDNLVGATVRPLIAVFVQAARPVNTYGARYIESLADELVPFIDATYRTVTSPEGRASVGHGFTGVTAINTGFMRSDVFGKVAAQSVYWASDPARLTQPMRTPREQPIALYIDWGAYDVRSLDENWDLGQTSRFVFDAFASAGFSIAGGEAPEGAGWSSWRNRTDRLLQSLFPRD